MKNKKTALLTQFSFFVAIIIILAFTPIGFIQLGFIKATIIHVPVIIGSIILGPKLGACLGFLFGLISLITNTITPVVSSFAFSPFIPVPGTSSGSLFSLIICFIPRILVGVIPWFAYKFLHKIIKDKSGVFSYTLAGVLGSMTNTLLVMNLIYLLFKDAYASIKDVDPQAVYGIILSIIFANGVPEALVAGILTAAICKALSFKRTSI